jgi:hypothetical protein
MKKINYLAILVTIFAYVRPAVVSAQQQYPPLSMGQELCVMIASEIKVPQLTPPLPTPSNWKKGALIEIGFSQLSLTNWAAGGTSSVSLNTYLNSNANYNINTMSWENRLQIAYGFIQSFEDGFKKSDDKFIFDSKLGYKAWNGKIYASALFNFRSQIANGYDKPSNVERKRVSAPFAPAYVSLGLGADYRPNKSLSMLFTPLTGNLVIVTLEELRTKYGNPVESAAKLKLGAQLKIDYNQKIHKNVAISTSAIFFSDFLGEPQNIKVNWDFFLDAKINKFFSANVRTNLIYDDDILIENEEGVSAPRVQFKEILSVGFSYTLGEFKK